MDLRNLRIEGKPIIVGISASYVDTAKERDRYPFVFCYSKNEALAMNAIGYSALVFVSDSVLQAFALKSDASQLPSYIQYILLSYHDFQDMNYHAGICNRGGDYVTSCYYDDKWPGDRSRDSVLSTSLGDLMYKLNVFSFSAVIVLKADRLDLPELGFFSTAEMELQMRLKGVPSHWIVTKEKAFPTTDIAGTFIWIRLKTDEPPFTKAVATIDYTDRTTTRRQLLRVCHEIDGFVHS